MSRIAVQRSTTSAAVALVCFSLIGCGSGSDDSNRAVDPLPNGRVVVAHAPTKAFDTPPKSRAARAAMRACSGLTPEQVRSAYATKAAASTDRSDHKFLKAALKREVQTPVPLAARLYSMTVPKSSRADAYVACAHVLFSKEPSR